MENNTPPIIDTGEEAPGFVPDDNASTFVPAPEDKKKGSAGTIVFAILFFLALAAGGYFFYSGMETNKKVDDLTKKNKDLTAQLESQPTEEQDASGDISGDLLAEITKEYNIDAISLKNGVDGTTEIMSVSLSVEDNPTGGFRRFYYREMAGTRWHLVAEGNGIADCLYYDEGVAAAFGDALPCIVPAEEDEDSEEGEGTDTPDTPTNSTDNTTTEE